MVGTDKFGMTATHFDHRKNSAHHWNDSTALVN